MAFELYGMLAGNVSPMTGENIKPAYGGEEEAFLSKVVTPIYNVIAKVLPVVSDYILVVNTVLYCVIICIDCIH